LHYGGDPFVYSSAATLHTPGGSLDKANSLEGCDGDIATRGDLQERSLLVSLPSIPEERGREKNTFWADFEATRTRIFGALLSGASAALRNADDVYLERKPRMADFAVRATTMEAAFGWAAGSFLEVY